MIARMGRHRCIAGAGGAGADIGGGAGTGAAEGGAPGGRRGVKRGRGGSRRAGGSPCAGAYGRSSGTGSAVVSGGWRHPAGKSLRRSAGRPLRRSIGNSRSFSDWRVRWDVLPPAIHLKPKVPQVPPFVSKLAGPGAGGHGHGDLIELLTPWARLVSERPYARVITALLAQARVDPVFAAEYQRRVIEPRRAGAREIFARAAARGETRPDLDVEVALDLIYLRLLHDHAPVTDTFVRSVIDLALGALAAGALTSD
jgi:hypothetical protein